VKNPVTFCAHCDISYRGDACPICGKPTSSDEAVIGGTSLWKREKGWQEWPPDAGFTTELKHGDRCFLTVHNAWDKSVVVEGYFIEWTQSFVAKSGMPIQNVTAYMKFEYPEPFEKKGTHEN
jgi:hypothetical protein